MKKRIIVIESEEANSLSAKANEALMEYDGQEIEILFADTKVFYEGDKYVYTTTIALSIKD